MDSQSSELPPAQPAYVLRGHSAQIHSVHFLRDNLRLLTGDADGWAILWHVPIKRPAAVWRAHNSAILALNHWATEKIITHGRDDKLIVWQLRGEDEEALSKVLPIDDQDTERKQPWLLHSLHVNALNFCSFALCPQQSAGKQHALSHSILIAVPGVQDGHIAVTALPEEQRRASIVSPAQTKTGMVMALALHYHHSSLLVIAGYESGHTCGWQQNADGFWQTFYLANRHSQPVLSLDVAPSMDCYFTSSADAIIARHPLSPSSSVVLKIAKTKHAGQQSLSVRCDGEIFATAGWDGRARVYSTKTMRELACLKWHKQGCYGLAFADIVSGFSTAASSRTAPDEDTAVAKRDLTVSAQRTAKAQATHWLAAGSKDGKVSLWDIY